MTTFNNLKKFNHVNKFPQYKLKISGKAITSGDDQNNCDTFKRDKLKDNADKPESFANTCKQIVEYQAKPIKEDESSEAELCKYIIYWFYKTLKENGRTSYKELINQFFNDIKSLNFCNKHIEDIKKEDYDKIEKLFKLYEDFYEFKKESIDHEKNTCTHGEECVKICDQNVDICRNDYNNDFCMKLIEFKYEYDNFYTQMLICRNKFAYLRPIKGDVSVYILIAIGVMSVISLFLFILFKVIYFIEKIQIYIYCFFTCVTLFSDNSLHHVAHGYVLDHLEVKGINSTLKCKGHKIIQKWKSGDTKYHITHHIPNLNIKYNHNILIDLNKNNNFEKM
ncbi:hypothetical protein PVMG_06122 [Plasmodium vivax Mauritania I]|uniref:Variable surface protein n=1 Tax=Plasmodium vivax Mauritania I TaxID=1035515 RepID=A0A0J9T4V4_PLAVI|nr:hypothetical protein PVMG_06122 [Plasmodium vivax Mauritania I]